MALPVTVPELRPGLLASYPAFRDSAAPPAPGGSALLLEDGSYLLLEDGSKILLE